MTTPWWCNCCRKDSLAPGCLWGSPSLRQVIQNHVLCHEKEPSLRFLLEVCEVEAEPRDRWGHTPLWDAQMFSRYAKTSHLDFVLPWYEIIGGVTILWDSQMFSMCSRTSFLDFFLVTLFFQEGGCERAEKASECDENGVQRDWGGGSSPNESKLKR